MAGPNPPQRITIAADYDELTRALNQYSATLGQVNAQLPTFSQIATLAQRAAQAHLQGAAALGQYNQQLARTVQLTQQLGGSRGPGAPPAPPAIPGPGGTGGPAPSTALAPYTPPAPPAPVSVAHLPGVNLPGSPPGIAPAAAGGIAGGLRSAASGLANVMGMGSTAARIPVLGQIVAPIVGVMTAAAMGSALGHGADAAAAHSLSLETLYRRGAGRGWPGGTTPFLDFRASILGMGNELAYSRDEVLALAEQLAAGGGAAGLGLGRLQNPMQAARFLGTPLAFMGEQFATLERIGGMPTSRGIPSGFQRVLGPGFGAPPSEVLSNLFGEMIDRGGMRGREQETLRSLTGLMERMFARTGTAPGVERMASLTTALNATGVPGLRGASGAQVLGALDQGIAGAGGTSELMLYQAFAEGARARGEGPLSWIDFQYRKEQGLGGANNLQDALRLARRFYGNDTRMLPFALKQMGLGQNLSLSQMRQLLESGALDKVPDLQGATPLEQSAIPVAVSGGPGVLGPGESVEQAKIRLDNVIENLANTTIVDLRRSMTDLAAEFVNTADKIANGGKAFLDAMGKWLDIKDISELPRVVTDIVNPPTAHSGELTPAQRAYERKTERGAPRNLPDDWENWVDAGAIRRGEALPPAEWGPPPVQVPIAPKPPAAAPVPPPATPGTPRNPQWGTPPAAAPQPPPAAPESRAGLDLSQIPHIDQSDAAVYRSIQDHDEWWREACSAAALAQALRGAGFDVNISQVLDELGRGRGVTHRNGLEGYGYLAEAAKAWGGNLVQDVDTYEDILAAVGRGEPVLASLKTPQWGAGHFVTVVGGNAEALEVRDPASTPGLTAISRGDFMRWWRRREDPVHRGLRFANYRQVAEDAGGPVLRRGTPPNALPDVPSRFEPSVARWEALARANEEATGVPSWVWLGAIAGESHGDPEAENRTSGAVGLLQHTPVWLTDDQRAALAAAQRRGERWVDDPRRDPEWSLRTARQRFADAWNDLATARQFGWNVDDPVERATWTIARGQVYESLRPDRQKAAAYRYPDDPANDYFRGFVRGGLGRPTALSPSRLGTVAGTPLDAAALWASGPAYTAGTPLDAAALAALQGPMNVHVSFEPATIKLDLGNGVEREVQLVPAASGDVYQGIELEPRNYGVPA